MKLNNTPEEKVPNGPRCFWTHANMCTCSRIPLLAVLMVTFARDQFVLSVILIALIGASDLFDGWIARRTGTASELGARLDVFADAVVVFSFQAFLVLRGEWPGYLLVLYVISICTFVLGARIRGRVLKNAFGQYMGAVAIGLFFLAAVLNAIDPGLWARAISVLAFPVAGYVMLATGESLVGIRRPRLRGEHEQSHR